MRDELGRRLPRRSRALTPAGLQKASTALPSRRSTWVSLSVIKSPFFLLPRQSWNKVSFKKTSSSGISLWRVTTRYSNHRRLNIQAPGVSFDLFISPAYTTYNNILVREFLHPTALPHPSLYPVYWGMRKNAQTDYQKKWSE